MVNSKAIGLSLLLVLIAASSGMATPIVIDFDDQPQLGLYFGVPIISQYPQVVFSSQPGYLNRVTTQPDFNGSNPDYSRKLKNRVTLP